MTWLRECALLAGFIAFYTVVVIAGSAMAWALQDLDPVIADLAVCAALLFGGLCLLYAAVGGIRRK